MRFQSYSKASLIFNTCPDVSSRQNILRIFNRINCFKYRWTSLSAVFLSANSLFHIWRIGLKCQIYSQNVSFYLRIQYSWYKIAGRIYLEYRGLPFIPKQLIFYEKNFIYVEIRNEKCIFILKFFQLFPIRKILLFLSFLKIRSKKLRST